MIKESLARLPSQVRKQIMLAFEQGLQHVVDLSDGSFISVNLTDDVLDRKGYKVLEEAGVFRYGKK